MAVRRAVDSRKLKVKSLAAFLFAFLLGCAPQRVQAQFLGYTSPQTVQQQVFNNIAAPSTSATIQNIGQTMHFVFYRATNTTAVEVVIEADSGDGTWVEVSNRATALTSGFVYASGYYPRTRARVLTLDGINQTLSAWYSGTSSAMGPEAGRFRSSGTEITLVANNLNAAVASGWILVNLPFRSTEGTIFFVANSFTGVTAATGPHLILRTSHNPQSCAATFYSDVLVRLGSLETVAVGTLVSKFPIPAISAGAACVYYNFAAAPAGGTYSIFYSFGSTDPSKGLRHTFLAQNAAAPSEGFSVQQIMPSEHTVELAVTGGPATCTYQLEGSLNSTTGVDGTWFALSGAVDCTVAANRMFHVVNKPVPWVRGNLTALAGGAAPTVTLSYLGVR